MYADMSGYHDRMSMPTMGYGAHSPTASGDFRMSMPAMPVGMFPTSPTAAPPYVPLLIKDDDQFKKYFKLRSMGMPDEQIKLKMSAEKIDPTILDRPDDVSPNDPGVRASLAVHPTPAVDVSYSDGKCCIGSHHRRRQEAHRQGRFLWSSCSVS
jgi:hypothetical protein